MRVWDYLLLCYEKVYGDAVYMTYDILLPYNPRGYHASYDWWQLLYAPFDPRGYSDADMGFKGKNLYCVAATGFFVSSVILYWFWLETVFQDWLISVTETAIFLSVSGYWLADLYSGQLSSSGYWLAEVWLLVSRQLSLWLLVSCPVLVTGSGPSAGTQGSATQDPHIAASDSSSDFDVMEGYPMQQHPESSSQDMHALGQQPGIRGGEVDSPFTSQIDPVLFESAHVSTPTTTPIGLSKLTPYETLLPDCRSLAEVQEVERYILAAREKEIESLRKAEQRRATLAKAPMTSTNPLQSPEITTLTSQPIGSHIASGSKDTPNTSILDGVFLNENWEYNLQTEKLTDLYTSYTYHVGWLDVIQATSNSTSVDEQQRMICDVIHSIVQMERQNLGINMPSMDPMRFLDTTKAKQPTISQMETPSVSPMDPSYIVSPGVSMQSEPTHGSFSFPDLVQPSLGDLPTPTMNMTGSAPSTSLAGTTPLHTSIAPMPIPIGVHQPYVPVATHPYVAPMPPPNPTAYVPQSHYPSPYFSGTMPASINTSYPTSAIPEPTSTSFRPSLSAVPYEVWDPRRVRMPRPKPANPFPYVVPRVPTPVASTPIMPTHLGDLAAFAQTIGRSIVENMHNLPDREPRSKAVQVAKIAQKYNVDGDVRKHVEIFEQAMVGFVWALAAEKLTGLSVMEQLFNPATSGLLWFAAVVQLFTLASIIAFANGESTDARRWGPFNAKAERWNGRLAMIRFAALVIDKMIRQGPLIYP
ncbi:hypothetical protein L7F22_060585 [Adiantum nelumboides]|nr:hypothetical protein [Adiantum nelumboides]